MQRKLSRREFLKDNATLALAALAVTACGTVWAMPIGATKPLDEIVVNEDGLIIDTPTLEAAQAVTFVLRGKKCILLYNDGQIRAFENICTHKGGPNALRDRKLVCTWHGALFDPLTGAAVKGPAPAGSHLPPVAIREEGGKVYCS